MTKDFVQIPTTDIPMTPSQERALEFIVNDFFRTHNHADFNIGWGRMGGYPKNPGHFEYELKHLEVEGESRLYRRHLRVIIEVGRKGDEGTMAAIFCRDRVQFWIGRGGQVFTFIHYHLKNGRYKSQKLIGSHKVIFSEVIEKTKESKYRNRKGGSK
jgi:hypothetical protein